MNDGSEGRAQEPWADVSDQTDTAQPHAFEQSKKCAVGLLYILLSGSQWKGKSLDRSKLTRVWYILILIAFCYY